MRLFILIILVFILNGCSGGGLISPIEPQSPVEQLQAPGAGSEAEQRASDSNQSLWGVWTFALDRETMTIEPLPARNLLAHFNITEYIMPPACDGCLSIHVNSFDTSTFMLDIDVTLINKMPVQGRDVRGIIYTDDYGHLLTNGDGWTGLFDVLGGESINPFKAYCQDDYFRIFDPNWERAENFLIQCPHPPKFNLITFAVTASWPGNCKEPYKIWGFQLQNEITDEEGSGSEVGVFVIDWQQDVSEVTLSAPEVTGMEAIPMSSSMQNLWNCYVENAEVVDGGDYDCLITAKSENSGGLCLYRKFKLHITDTGPPPEPVPCEGNTWGGYGNDAGEDITVDLNGNIYVCGGFEEIVDFDLTENTQWFESNGSKDAFITKLNGSGQYQWTKTWGGELWDTALAVETDNGGYVYITGRFSGTVDFNPAGEGIEERTAVGNADAFLLKLNGAGQFLWVNTWGGYDEPTSMYYTAVNVGEALAFDNIGNIYVAGSFVGTDVDFDPGGGIDMHSSNGKGDVFISKFDTGGDFIWARTWGGPGTGYPPYDSWFCDTGLGVEVDSMGNPWIAGSFEGKNVDFDPGPGEDLHDSTDSQFVFFPTLDVFLSKFDSAGNFTWAGDWGDRAYEDWGAGIAIDSEDNVYVNGEFACIVDFDPGPGSEAHESGFYGNYNSDAFLTKFNNACEHQWALTWGSEHEWDSTWDVNCGIDGGLYVVGEFVGDGVAIS